MAAREHCGEPFEATNPLKRKIYCSTNCQYEARSAEYQDRPNVHANLKRAVLARRRKAKGQPAESALLR
jgi:hypothetical protein